MHKFFFGLISCVLLTSCHDMKKQKQLDQVQSMLVTTDSIAKTWESAQTDSMQFILSDVRQVEQKIRSNNNPDTISIEFSQKLEDYKMISKGLNAFMQNNEKIVDSGKQIRFSLTELQKDIETGSGDRSKYDEYIHFEKNKVSMLNVLLKNNMETKTKCVNSYQRLHTEIKEFSESK